MRIRPSLNLALSRITRIVLFINLDLLHKPILALSTTVTTFPTTDDLINVMIAMADEEVVFVVEEATKGLIAIAVAEEVVEQTTVL